MSLIIPGVFYERRVCAQNKANHACRFALLRFTKKPQYPTPPQAGKILRLKMGPLLMLLVLLVLLLRRAIGNNNVGNSNAGYKRAKYFVKSAHK